ncbi:MAG: hypothetical protein GXY58_20015 [Planctomycetaceae bacterium]|nr:hypothetical protein [Planctomycetaceae bacterium]
MNYFAHGYQFIEDPYFLSGTAVPDWLAVIDRRVRARARLARPWTADPDTQVAAVAAGVVRHHEDDAWFHRTRAFAELSLTLTVEAREVLAGESGFRPSFLGHILVEVLLDSTLIAQDVGRLDRYYRALESIDPAAVTRAVERMSTGLVPTLEKLISLFCTERFLYDYLDDATLLARLNRVMKRVKLPALPPAFLTFLPRARAHVDGRCTELLTKETKEMYPAMPGEPS